MEKPTNDNFLSKLFINEAKAALTSRGGTGAEDSVLARTVTTYKNNSVTSLGSACFRDCVNLISAEFASITSIGVDAFSGCSSLFALVLRADTVVSIADSNVFNGTPIASGNGYVYVKDHLISLYETDANWSRSNFKYKKLSDFNETGSKPIVFNIGDRDSGEVPPGITWAQWCSIKEFYSTLNGYLYYLPDSMYVVDSDGHGLRGDTEIVAGSYSYSNSLDLGLDEDVVSFRIYAQTGPEDFYEFETTVAAGTTWAQWCETTYIPEISSYGWSVESDGIVYHHLYSMALRDGSGNYVKGADVIKSGLYTF